MTINCRQQIGLIGSDSDFEAKAAQKFKMDRFFPQRLKKQSLCPDK